MYLLAINQTVGKIILVGGSLWLLLSSLVAAGQSPPPDSLEQRSLRQFWIVTGASYVGAQAGLYAAWYRNQSTQQFRFFDDGAQWKQVDKIGHLYSAFHLSQISAAAFQRAGVASPRSQWYGSLAGWLLLLPVEVFDGFSQAYGFSWPDIVANTTGSVLFLGQHALWQEVRVHPKFSFHRTTFASERPNTLGSNLAEEVLKDYNGQTYWLSVDLRSFLHRRYPQFPRWLNMAVGYGAHRMLHAREAANQAAGYTAYREFFLTVDVDLHGYRKPPTTFGNRLWNGLLYAVNLIHLPAPALSYQTGRGFVFYPLYF